MSDEQMYRGDYDNNAEPENYVNMSVIYHAGHIPLSQRQDLKYKNNEQLPLYPVIYLLSH